MGLFSKKEDCPVCGGEVKGLFLKKIADKKTLCKNCSEQLSMKADLLKAASPDYMREHLEYRRKNAEWYTAAHWDAVYEPLSLQMGVDLNEKTVYIRHIDMDDLDNPVVFSFDQITDYALYRMKKKVDDAQDPGDTALESGMSVLSGFNKLAGKGNDSYDYLKLCLTTTDPYWPDLELKFNNPDNELYSFGGCAEELKTVCQILKRIVRREPVHI